MPLDNIVQLAQSMDRLARADRERFDRIFRVSATRGALVPPESTRAWIAEQFGSVEAVTSQRIVRVTNIVTWESTRFNALRAQRPIKTTDANGVRAQIRASAGDPFCHPLDGTPADVFGRVTGRACVTASNIAKYDGWHGLVIFNEHDPLAFTRETIIDALRTAREWYARAHAADAAAVYPLFIWNCLWRSGSSIVHGHAQMTLAREMPYAKIEHLRRAALQYQAEHRANYFDDLYQVHAALGLTWTNDGVRALASLTPIKEKEIVLLADQSDDALASAIHRVLRTYVSDLGVVSFNLAIYLKPLASVSESWDGFPVVAHLVDRGDLGNSTCDFGAVELYAASVVASDPFDTARAMQ
jgi:hypothetical protein